MAKIFGGFTTQQQVQLLAKMGIDVNPQQDEINKVLMSNPKAASMMGKYAEMAKARVTGGPEAAMQVGGYIAPPNNMQQQMAALDYNKLYADPNKPTSGYNEGGVGSEDEVSTDPVIDDGPVGYDPSQGLPDPVGNLYTDVNIAYEDAFKSDFNAGTEGKNKNVGDDITWAKTNVSQMSNVADPKDYKLGTFVHTNGKTYIQLEYPDGTVIPTYHKDNNFAIGRANILAAAVNASKNVVTPEEKTALEKQYENNLQMYQSYQAKAASDKAETAVFKNIEAAQSQVNRTKNVIQNYSNELAGLGADDPKRATLEKLIADEQVRLNQAKAGLKQSTDRAKEERRSQRLQTTTEFSEDPKGQVSKAQVETISADQKEAGMIDDDVGQADEVDDATLTKAQLADKVAEPTVKEAEKASLATATPEVTDTVNKLVAATGEPSAGALAIGAEMTPQELASLGLTVGQIEQATQVVAPQQLKVSQDELISDEVDFEQAKAETNFVAATGVPSSEATVQGQLTQLLQDFEGGETPAWAAGAMRTATATLAARGLGASSMAGQAIVQAAMEAALPIAMADAQTVASFEAQNLSNRQQAAMFAAEQRSKFLGMKFDQKFQSRVQNAARIADVANINFNAEQQIALENARLTQTVNIANLDARNAKIMADAAAMSQVDITNLNNRQQAAIQYANSFLQMDMANLTNEQQATMFKSQSIVQALLSDQAAENATEQFNAKSVMQVDQFYDSMTAQVQQFNADQENAIERFNAGEANALAQFNKQSKERREEFNATQSLVVEQANAKWMQDVALADTAAQNEANAAAARAENEMSLAVYEAEMQAERDAMSYAFQTANNNADRATSIALQTMQNEAAANSAAASKSASFASAAGAVIANVIKG